VQASLVYVDATFRTGARLIVEDPRYQTPINIVGRHVSRVRSQSSIGLTQR
jgi:hypothetical protein